MKRHLVLGILLVTLFSACAKKADLKNTWVMTEYLGSPINTKVFSVKIPALILNPNEGNFAGNNGCNQFSGKMSVNDNTIQLEILLGTKMFCDGVPEQEFEAHLASVDNYKIKGNKLYLKKESTTLFVFQLKNE